MMKHFIILLLAFLCIGSASAQAVAEHTVKAGETLQTIASRYGISVAELKAANTGLDEYVFAGMVLKLPVKLAKPVEASGQIILPVDDLKDVIYLKDGSELVAKILSIEADVIKFEQYDTDEPFTIQMSDVISIKFEDGRVLDHTVQPKKGTSTRRTTTKRHAL